MGCVGFGQVLEVTPLPRRDRRKLRGLRPGREPRHGRPRPKQRVRTQRFPRYRPKSASTAQPSERKARRPSGSRSPISTTPRGHRRHACGMPAPTPPSARSSDRGALGTHRTEDPTSEATAGSHAAPSEFTARLTPAPSCPGQPRGPAPAAPRRTYGVQAQGVRLQRRLPAAGVLLPRQVRPRLPAPLAAQAPAAEVGGGLRLVGAASATQAPGSEGARARGRSAEPPRSCPAAHGQAAPSPPPTAPSLLGGPGTRGLTCPPS